MQIWNLSKGIRGILVQILAIWKSNPNCNNSKGIRTIPMQIPTIRKGFEVFDSKFESFERD